MHLLAQIKALRHRAKGRNFLELAKFMEIEALGRHASTYCLHHPSHVLIELTTRCNLRCGYCNQSDAGWQKAYGHKDMPFETFERIIPQLKGSKVLLLYNIGEPLLYRRIYDAIRLARQYIPDVRITSNGLLWTKEIAANLQQAGLTQMNLSIDAPDADVMQRNRGADLAKIERNLQEFGSACNIPVEIWSVINDADAELLSTLPDWARRFPAVKGLYFQLQNGVENSTESNLPILISRERFDDLKKSIAERCDKLGLETNIGGLPFYPDGFAKKEAQGICKAPFTQLVAINVDGRLSPCCSYATHGLGNVVDEGFKAVWNGQEMRDWREDMLQQRYCAYCSEWCGYKQGRAGESLSIEALPNKPDK